MKKANRSNAWTNEGSYFNKGLMLLGKHADIKNCKLIQVQPGMYRMSFSTKASALVNDCFAYFGGLNKHTHCGYTGECELPLIDTAEVMITTSAHQAFLKGGVNEFLYLYVNTRLRCEHMARNRASSQAYSEVSLLTFNQKMDDNPVAVEAKVIYVPRAELPVVRTFIFAHEVESLSQL